MIAGMLRPAKRAGMRAGKRACSTTKKRGIRATSWSHCPVALSTSSATASTGSNRRSTLQQLVHNRAHVLLRVVRAQLLQRGQHRAPMSSPNRAMLHSSACTATCVAQRLLQHGQRHAQRLLQHGQRRVQLLCAQPHRVHPVRQQVCQVLHRRPPKPRPPLAHRRHRAHRRPAHRRALVLHRVHKRTRPHTLFPTQHSHFIV